MSECKFLSEQGTGMCSIAGCGCTYLHPNLARCIEEENIDAWEELSSLRAKLDEKERILNLANKALKSIGSAAHFGQHIEIPDGTLVFKDTEETLDIDADDEPAYSVKQWNALQANLEAAQEWINKSADLLEHTEKERDDLKQQVEKLTAEVNNTNMINDDLLKTFGEMEDDHREDCANAARFANELDDAYSTIAQMRGALKEAKPYIDSAAQYKKLIEMGATWDDPEAATVRDNIRNALSIPHTDYEQKVQGLMDALENILWQASADGPPRGAFYKTIADNIVKISQQALAAFRGGE